MTTDQGVETLVEVSRTLYPVSVGEKGNLATGAVPNARGTALCRVTSAVMPIRATLGQGIRRQTREIGGLSNDVASDTKAD